MALSWTSGLLEKLCITSAGDRTAWEEPGWLRDPPEGRAPGTYLQAPHCSHIYVTGHEWGSYHPPPPLCRPSSRSRVKPKPILGPHSRLKMARAFP